MAESPGPRGRSTASPLRPGSEAEELIRAVYGMPRDPAAPELLTPGELDRIFSPASPRRASEGIDPELLAAFLDGVLDDDERAEVLRTLAEDATAYRQFVTAARFRIGREQRRSDPSEPPAILRRQRADDDDVVRLVAMVDEASEDADVSHLPTRRTDGRSTVWRWAVPLAAAAILAVGLWYVLRPAPLAPPSSRLLAAIPTVPGTVGLTGFELPPRILRGPDGPFEPEARAALFTLGARTFDLAWAARAGDREQLEGRLKEVPGLLETALFVAPNEAAPYLKLAGRLAEGENPSSLAEPIAAAESALLTELGWSIVHFGRWVESARFAALSRDEGFFRDPEAYLEPLARFRKADPSDEVAAWLAELPASPDAPLDFERISGSLEAILEHCMSGRTCLDSV